MNFICRKGTFCPPTRDFLVALCCFDISWRYVSKQSISLYSYYGILIRSIWLQNPETREKGKHDTEASCSSFFPRSLGSSTWQLHYSWRAPLFKLNMMIFCWNLGLYRELRCLRGLHSCVKFIHIVVMVQEPKFVHCGWMQACPFRMYNQTRNWENLFAQCASCRNMEHLFCKAGKVWQL